MALLVFLCGCCAGGWGSELTFLCLWNKCSQPLNHLPSSLSSFIFPSFFFTVCFFSDNRQHIPHWNLQRTVECGLAVDGHRLSPELLTPCSTLCLCFAHQLMSPDYNPLHKPRINTFTLRLYSWMRTFGDSEVNLGTSLKWAEAP